MGAARTIALAACVVLAGCSCGKAGGGADSGTDTEDVRDTAADLPGEDVAPEVREDLEPDPDADPDIVDVAEVSDTGEDVHGPPAGCVEGTFQPYWGNLHAHTSHSDGEGIPSEAFAYARDVAGLDFLAVTDHLEQLYLPGSRWDACNDQADAADAPGVYVAICGYEYGSGFILPWFWSTGHNNVFFCADLMPEIQLDFRDFYRSLEGCPGAVGQFNHPGEDDTQDWNDFEYHPWTDMKMSLFEFNGDGATWDLFFQALDAGWHVSPVWNQDNHSADWGTDDDGRAGLMMSALTRDAMRDAMIARRSFMSEDRDAYLTMMAETTCWMGSILTGLSSSTLDLEAADSSDGFSTIEIHGPGPTLIDSHDCAGATFCTVSFDLTAVPAYVVPRAVQADGDVLVAAPIWWVP